MFRLIQTILAAGALALAAPAVLAADPVAVPLRGDIAAPGDISAIAFSEGFLIIGSDEAVGKKKRNNVIQLFEPDGDGFRLVATHTVLEGTPKDGTELDIEGFAVDDDELYILGSHSRRRLRPEKDRSREDNLKWLTRKAVVRSKNRELILQVEIESDGEIDDIDQFSLREVIHENPVLTAFKTLPGKENGIDIEGLAFHDDELYLGFRGPVLRGGYVPVLRVEFDDADDHELLFVRLGGLGIRSIASVSDGFLIIAGPVGGGEGAFRVFHWNGGDMVPGSDVDPETFGKVRDLGPLPAPAGGNAEGMAVTAETEEAYEVLVAYDGVKDPDRILWRHTITR